MFCALLFLFFGGMRILSVYKQQNLVSCQNIIYKRKIKETEDMNLQETLEKIQPLNEHAMEIAKKKWDSIAHPLHSLGLLEDVLVQIAGITGQAGIDIKKKVLVPMCADNGVVEEGVTQSGQEITMLVAETFLTYQSAAARLCKEAGADVFPRNHTAVPSILPSAAHWNLLLFVVVSFLPFVLPVLPVFPDLLCCYDFSLRRIYRQQPEAERLHSRPPFPEVSSSFCAVLRVFFWPFLPSFFARFLLR